MTTTLYRMFDAAGQLLYVGISARALGRWEAHRHDKSWWSEVDRITVEHFPSREEALAAETAAIIAERPRYNIAGAIGSAALSVQEVLADELQRPAATGLGSLIVKWPVAQRLAEQWWHVVRSRHGTWGVALIVDGWYPDKRSAQDLLAYWADRLEEDALVVPDDRAEDAVG